MINKLILVQLLRAGAIIFVMLGHLNALMYEEFSHHWFGMGEWERTGGVDVFFVISGFMITYVYSRHIGESGKALFFLKKRLLRIIPFYWIVTVGAASLFFTFPHLGSADDRSIGNIVSSFLFLNTDPTLVVAWSLSHVILFYIMFSLLLAKPKLMKVMLPVWIAVSVLSIIGIAPFNQLNNVLFGLNNLEIWAGVAIAYWIGKRSIKYDALLAVLGAAIYLFVWFNNAQEFVLIDKEIFRPVLYGIGACLILTGIVSIDLRKSVSIPSALTLIGNASFSIFLTHSPFLQFYLLIFEKTGFFSRFGLDLSMVIISAFTIMTGCMVYKVIETPLNLLIGGEYKVRIPIIVQKKVG